jgi:hypothetical protein
MIIRFTVLAILEKKGIEVNNYFVTWRHVLKLKKVMNEEIDTKEKRKYKILFWSTITLPILFTVLILLYIGYVNWLIENGK